jgi:hypothetical protein
MQKHGVIIIKNHTGNFVERYPIIVYISLPLDSASP